MSHLLKTANAKLVIPQNVRRLLTLLKRFPPSNVHGVDLGTYVSQARRAVNDAIARGEIQVPTGYNIIWSGQYEYMQRARQRLMLVIPLTLLIILLIIYLNTRSLTKTAIVLLAVPFSLVGAFWMLDFAGYNLSVAVWVGIIALAGLDAETGVVMLLYLDLAFEHGGAPAACGGPRTCAMSRSTVVKVSFTVATVSGTVPHPVHVNVPVSDAVDGVLLGHFGEGGEGPLGAVHGPG